MRKAAIEVRIEARTLALEYAKERDESGDPEGADWIRDLANAIDGISLDKPDQRQPSIEERPY